MKRSLFESIRAIPYTLGSAIDRLSALSGVLGINVITADANAVANVTITHSDTADSSFEPVLDERIFLSETRPVKNNDGAVTGYIVSAPVEAGQLLNMEIDLVGCKQYIKVNVEYTAGDSAATASAGYVITLGDFNQTPAE